MDSGVKQSRKLPFSLAAVFFLLALLVTVKRMLRLFRSKSTRYFSLLWREEGYGNYGTQSQLLLESGLNIVSVWIWSQL